MEEKEETSKKKKRVLEIDPQAKQVYEKMKDEVLIDKTTWISLEYTSMDHVKVSGSGNEGLEEAKNKAITDEKISFVVVKGAQIKSKTSIETIFLLILWIPDCVSSLKRAISILNIDEVVRTLDIETFFLIEPNKIEDISVEYISQRLKIIRGDESVGKYVFDKRVYPLLFEYSLRGKKKAWKKTTKKEIEKCKRGESHVLRELLSTEQTYVKSLTLLYDFVKAIGEQGHEQLCKKISDNVISITNVNKKFLNELREVYGLELFQSDEDILKSDPTQLKKKLETLGPEFFTDERICKIMDILCQTCPDFRKYSIYVNKYPVMLQEMEKTLKQDKKLKSVFDSLEKTLKSKRERCTKFPSFIIMPIQRLPRYELLTRELLRSTHVDSTAHSKIKETMRLIKEVGDTINERKETMVNAIKTIFITKLTMKPYLMEQMVQKFKYCQIIKTQKRKKKKKKKKKKNSKNEEEDDNINREDDLYEQHVKLPKSGMPGIVYIFKRTCLIMKTKNSKAFKIDELLSADVDVLMKKNKATLYGEIPLDDPNVRCYKHSKIPELCIIEASQERKFQLLFPNSAECQSVVKLTQSLLSEFHDELDVKSIESIRPLFKSWMEWKKESGNSKVKRKKRFLFAIHADLKVKAYQSEEDLSRDEVDHSFSVIGAKFGKVEFIEEEEEKVVDAADHELLGSIRSINEALRSQLPLPVPSKSQLMKCNTIASFSESQLSQLRNGMSNRKGGPQVNDNDDDDDDQILGRGKRKQPKSVFHGRSQTALPSAKQKSCWFYIETPEVITKKASFVKMQKVKKKKNDGKNNNLGSILTATNRRYVFLSESVIDMATWFGILERLGCERKDETMKMDPKKSDLSPSKSLKSLKSEKKKSKQQQQQQSAGFEIEDDNDKDGWAVIEKKKKKKSEQEGESNDPKSPNPFTPVSVSLDPGTPHSPVISREDLQSKLFSLKKSLENNVNHKKEEGNDTKRESTKKEEKTDDDDNNKDDDDDDDDGEEEDGDEEDEEDEAGNNNLKKKKSKRNVFRRGFHKIKKRMTQRKEKKKKTEEELKREKFAKAAARLSMRFRAPVFGSGGDEKHPASSVVSNLQSQISQSLDSKQKTKNRKPEESIIDNPLSQLCSDLQAFTVSSDDETEEEETETETEEEEEDTDEPNKQQEPNEAVAVVEKSSSSSFSLPKLGPRSLPPLPSMKSKKGRVAINSTPLPKLGPRPLPPVPTTPKRRIDQTPNSGVFVNTTTTTTTTTTKEEEEEEEEDEDDEDDGFVVIGTTSPKMIHNNNNNNNNNEEEGIESGSTKKEEFGDISKMVKNRILPPLPPPRSVANNQVSQQLEEQEQEDGYYEEEGYYEEDGEYKYYTYEGEGEYHGEEGYNDMEGN